MKSHSFAQNVGKELDDRLHSDLSLHVEKLRPTIGKWFSSITQCMSDEDRIKSLKLVFPPPPHHAPSLKTTWLTVVLFEVQGGNTKEG